MDDWRPLYPFGSRFIAAGEFRQHYVDEGAGPPLVMVHGNPTWSFYYRNLILGLKDDFRALAIDHIGCGLSDKPQSYPYCLATHIENLVRFLDQLDLQGATMLVHDWGGAIGLGAALRRPERIARLVLFNTGAFPPPFCPLRIRICRTPLIGKWGMQGLNLFARAALRMAVEKRERMTPATCAGFLAPYDNYQNRTAIAQFVADIPLSRRHPTWNLLAEIEAGLPSLADRPVQMIWGMKDWCFTPQCLEKFRDYFPRAEVHRLEDAGHYVLEDAHERIVPLVREFCLRTA